MQAGFSKLFNQFSSVTLQEHFKGFLSGFASHTWDWRIYSNNADTSYAELPRGAYAEEPTCHQAPSPMPMGA